MPCGMNVALSHKVGNELVRNVVWQVNSAQLPCRLALYLFPSLLTVGRCSSSELWVRVSASIHLSEENKLPPNCSGADCNGKTHKEIPLLLL